MFRVTYSQTISDEWRNRMLELPETKKRRIYRWGIHWGILEDGNWQCETRVPTDQKYMDSLDIVLKEVCTSVQVDILPLNIDDLWEEEYISIPKDSCALEYNGLLMIRGNAKGVLEIAEKQGLPIPLLPSVQRPSAHLPPVVHKKNTRCLIRD